MGNAALPADHRKSFLLAPTVKKDAALLPAGLLGPVRLLMEMQVQVRSK